MEEKETRGQRRSRSRCDALRRGSHSTVFAALQRPCRAPVMEWPASRHRSMLVSLASRANPTKWRKWKTPWIQARGAWTEGGLPAFKPWERRLRCHRAQRRGRLPHRKAAAAPAARYRST